MISYKNNNFKGSIRSVKGISAVEIINFLNNKNIILNGGGHNMAGGFTLKNPCIETIENLLKSYFSKIILKKGKKSQNRYSFRFIFSKYRINRKN